MLKAMCQRYFSPSTPLETVFTKCKRAGFDAVELAINKPGEQGITPDTTLKDARAIGDLARSSGIQLRSYMYGGGPSIISSDTRVREQNRQLLTRHMEVCAELGIDTILVVPGRVNAQIPYDECYLRTQEELALIMPEAEQHRVYLAIENIWNHFLLSPLEFARYVDELNSPYAGVYFDVGNVLKTGWPEQWIRILNKRIRKVHVKDFITGIASTQGFVPLLSGDVNWKEVREALREISYTDVLTAEVTGYAHASDQMLYDTARHIGVIIDGTEG